MYYISSLRLHSYGETSDIRLVSVNDLTAQQKFHCFINASLKRTGPLMGYLNTSEYD